MSKKEIDRLDIIRRLIRKEINGTKAAELLNLTVRQIRRIKKKVKEDGAKGIIHGNRGKKSNRKISEEENKCIITLLHKHYHDFGPTFATEKLYEIHNIDRDPKTIRSIQIKEGLWKCRNGKKQVTHRAWRPRKCAFGEMLQFDGSYHDWFEGSGKTAKQCLLATIDDATSTVVKAVFDLHEGVIPVMNFWKDYVLVNGKPRCIYLDKFSTYKVNHKIANENPDVKTQFERSCNDIGIQACFANSPQAKGRIERLFGTFQDRLIKELRLQNITTTEDANEFMANTFLPKFNAKFSVEPVSKSNFHKKLSIKEKNNLASNFSRHTKRTIQNDFTFAFNTIWYQLTKNQPCTVRKKEIVIVEEHLNGTIHVRYNGKELNYEVLPTRPSKIEKMPWILTTTREPNKPAKNHPWRNFHYGKKLINSNK